MQVILAKSGKFGVRFDRTPDEQNRKGKETYQDSVCPQLES